MLAYVRKQLDTSGISGGANPQRQLRDIPGIKFPPLIGVTLSNIPCGRIHMRICIRDASSSILMRSHENDDIPSPIGERYS